MRSTCAERLRSAHTWRILNGNWPAKPRASGGANPASNKYNQNCSLSVCKSPSLPNWIIEQSNAGPSLSLFFLYFTFAWKIYSCVFLESEERTGWVWSWNVDQGADGGPVCADLRGLEKIGEWCLGFFLGPRNN